MANDESFEAVTARLRDLAARCDRTGLSTFSPFLSPPEADAALIEAKRAHIYANLNGGYPDAERVMACFCTDDSIAIDYPIDVIEITWPFQNAPEHRDLLGSVMALGIRRGCIGDIVLDHDRAYLMADRKVSDAILSSWTQAGRISLHCSITSDSPFLIQPQGEERRDTVASLRLDAVVSSGFHMSRGDASELIEHGMVKLRHLPSIKPDARVEIDDVISVRGYGRIVLKEVGTLTKKGRFPIVMECYGNHIH